MSTHITFSAQNRRSLIQPTPPRLRTLPGSYHIRQRQHIQHPRIPHMMTPHQQLTKGTGSPLSHIRLTSFDPIAIQRAHLIQYESDLLLRLNSDPTKTSFLTFDRFVLILFGITRSGYKHRYPNIRTFI